MPQKRHKVVIGHHPGNSRNVVEVREMDDGSASIFFYSLDGRNFNSFEAALEVAKEMARWPGEDAEPQVADANGHFEVCWVNHLSHFDV